MDKTCNGCKETKSYESFYKDSASKTGRSSQCKECVKKRTKTWVTKNLERYKQTQKDRYFIKGGKARHKNRLLKISYNISLDEYAKMVIAQNNKCLICNQEPPSESRRPVLHVDHDHKTNKVRGLLCNNCNRAIGLLKENWEVIENARNYLIKYSPLNLTKGDVIVVTWWDIVGSSVGDPKQAKPIKCVTCGFFDCFDTRDGKECLITHLNEYEDGDVSGYDAYPLSVVETIIKPLNTFKPWIEIDEHFNHQETPPHDTPPQGEVRPLPNETM